jgi:hypothetical protein
MSGSRLVILVVLAVAGAAGATEEVVLTADADSYVYHYEEWGSDPQYEDDNFGAETLMYVLSNYYQWGDEDRRAFIHFDFSGLGEYAGADLVGAQLVFYAEHGGGGPQRFLTVLEAWDEMTITYNNEPMHGVELALCELNVGYNCVDMTHRHLKSWVDAPETAYGIVIRDTEQVQEYDPAAKIRTRETDYAPELHLFFTGEAVGETSWGQIKAEYE